MLNSKAFKKLAALTAAVALVGSFAVSASAAVTTKTTYVGSDIKVEVSVTGYDDGTHVTYYAEKAGTPYHVDQATVVDGTAKFDSFVTDDGNLDANVLVNGIEDKITGRKISVVKGTSDVTVIPTEETSVVVEITPTLTDGYEVDKITVEGATTTDPADTNDGKWSLTLSAFTAEEVVITVTEKLKVIEPTPVIKHIDSGWVKDGSGFKITVLGSVQDIAAGKAFGAKIGGTEYASKATYVEGEKYFAIQLISETYEAGNYTTAVYADGATDAAGETLVVPALEQ